MRNSNLLKPFGLYVGLLGFVAMITASVNAMAAIPEPWQIGLQEPAGSIAEKANDLHNLLLVIITAISVFVLALLIYTCLRFRESKKQSCIQNNT